MVEMCLSVSFRAGGGGGGGCNNKEPTNIHLGVVILRKFCLRYESILDPPMPTICNYKLIMLGAT